MPIWTNSSRKQNWSTSHRRPKHGTEGFRKYAGEV